MQEEGGDAIVGTQQGARSSPVQLPEHMRGGARAGSGSVSPPSLPLARQSDAHHYDPGPGAARSPGVPPGR